MKAMVSLLRLLSSDFDDEETSLRQVIVNSHSPVLLKYLYRDYSDSDNAVSIWFSKLISSSVLVEDQKKSLRISRITPLTKSFQYSFTEAENKMTIADAVDYLKTEDEVIKLCYYTNLQLLRAQDNLEKHDRLDWKVR